MNNLQLVLSVLICNEIINVESSGYYNVRTKGSFDIAKASKDCNSDGRYLASAHNQQEINKLQQLCQVFSINCCFTILNVTKNISDLSLNSLNYGLPRTLYVG